MSTHEESQEVPSGTAPATDAPPSALASVKKSTTDEVAKKLQPKKLKRRTSMLEALSYDYTPADCSRTALQAEFISMALFVWIGCGTAVSTQAFSASSSELDDDHLLATAMAFGWGIVVLAYSIAPISGGHINPAVTFAMVLLGKLCWTSGLLYLISQFLGAMLGAAILWGCTVSEEDQGAPPYLLGSNFVAEGVPLGSAFLLEFMGTFLLVWTVLNTAVSKVSIAANLAPMAIGFSVFLAHIVLIPFTGCGINPARSFGPHIVSVMAGETVGTAGWWIYYTAPFVGAGFAALVFKYIIGIEPELGDNDEELAENQLKADAAAVKTFDDANYNEDGEPSASVAA